MVYDSPIAVEFERCGYVGDKRVSRLDMQRKRQPGSGNEEEEGGGGGGILQ